MHVNFMYIVKLIWATHQDKKLILSPYQASVLGSQSASMAVYIKWSYLSKDGVCGMMVKTFAVSFFLGICFSFIPALPFDLPTKSDMEDEYIKTF